MYQHAAEVAFLIDRVRGVAPAWGAARAEASVVPSAGKNKTLAVNLALVICGSVAVVAALRVVRRKV